MNPLCPHCGQPMPAQNPHPGFGSGLQPSWAPAPGYPPAQQHYGYPSQAAPYYLPASQSPMSLPQSSYPPMSSAPTAPSGEYLYPQSAYAFPSSQPAYPPSQPYHPQLQASNASDPTNSVSAASTPQPNCRQTNACSQYETVSPTVVPIASFNARSDAEILKNAIERSRTDAKGMISILKNAIERSRDAKAIISVVTKRSHSQRLEIAEKYQSLFGSHLMTILERKLSGEFGDLIIALMTPLPEYLAKELSDVIMNGGQETLVEIIYTSTNAQIKAIKDAYCESHDASLENYIRNNIISFDFERRLQIMIKGNQKENAPTDEAKVASDAQKFMVGFPFNMFCTRSYHHLKRVLIEFERISGHTLEERVLNDSNLSTKALTLAIIRAIEDRALFFAQRLNNSMFGFKTIDRQLIRIVVGRCEVDMQDIKEAYQKSFQNTLEQDIGENTTGDYKTALLSLIAG